MNIILEKMQQSAKKHMDGNGVPQKPLFMPPMKVELQDGPLPDDLKEITGLVYKRVGDIVLRAELTYPKKLPASGKLPVMVYFHGGGLTMGDCSMCPAFRRRLAHMGYLVYSVDYRLLNQTDAEGMFADACDALAFIREDMKRFHGDPDSVFLMGESAGAFVSRMAAASARSPMLREHFGLTDFGLDLRAIFFFSGMFYTTDMDPIGIVYQKDLFGAHLGDPYYMHLVDPNNPDIIALLPPVFLTSSKGDFLRSYTLRFAKALHENGHPGKLIYFPDRKDLSHAFPPLVPSLPESAVVMAKMHNWIKQLPDRENP